MSAQCQKATSLRLGTVGFAGEQLFRQTRSRRGQFKRYEAAVDAAAPRCPFAPGLYARDLHSIIHVLVHLEDVLVHLLDGLVRRVDGRL
jgi:hypothetical protein